MKFIILSLSLVATAPAFAGGISGGGGGTTNPRPVAPAAVEEAVVRYGGPALLSWLKGAENAYVRSSDQENHPYRKLFAGEKTIYQVVAETKVELRFSRPCLDQNGQPWDGSMYADTPGAVCLSPFTMAPKLGATNVKDETLALLLHELSHLLGTTEEEADAIQESALVDFDHVDFDIFIGQPGLTSEPYQAASHLMEVANILKMSAFGVTEFNIRRASEFWRDYQNISEEVLFNKSKKFAMVRPATRDKIAVYHWLTTNLHMHAYTTDPKADPFDKTSNQRKLDEVFRTDPEVTAAVYRNRYFGHPDDEPFANPEYQNVRIHRILNGDDLKASLLQQVGFLNSVEGEIRQLDASGFEVVKQP